MRLLTALFCYNRYYLLRNSVESWLEFGPSGDLLIVDDGSDDERIIAYLNGLKSNSRITVQRRDRSQTDSHGGLYPNMNAAVDYALSKDYSHIFFLQDDVQFMWKDPTFEQRVEHVFAVEPNAAMVNCFFLKGIIAHQMRERLEPHQKANAWHIKPYGIVDVGIMPLKLLQEKQWRFGTAENSNSKKWVEWGYKLYGLSAPTLAFVPWPQVRSSNKTFGKERRLKRKYFLKPLNDAQIAQLVSMDLSAIPYQEDFCLPWGWRCLSPFWFTKFSWKHYGRYLRRCMKDGDFWPKLVKAN